MRGIYIISTVLLLALSSFLAVQNYKLNHFRNELGKKLYLSTIISNDSLTERNVSKDDDSLINSAVMKINALQQSFRNQIRNDTNRIFDIKLNDYIMLNRKGAAVISECISPVIKKYPQQTKKLKARYSFTTRENFVFFENRTPLETLIDLNLIKSEIITLSNQMTIK